MPSCRPRSRYQSILPGVGPAAGQPDQRLGLVQRPARGDVVGQLVLTVGLGVGAALVEGVAERQVQARPGSAVGRVPRDPRPGPRLGGLAARPLGPGGGEEGAGRLRRGQVAVGAQGVPRDADGEAGVGVVRGAHALGQRQRTRAGAGSGAAPGRRPSRAVTSSRWLPCVNRTPAEVSIHPRRRAFRSSRSASAPGRSSILATSAVSMTRSSAVIAAAASQARDGTAAGERWLRRAAVVRAASWSRIRTGSPPVARAMPPDLLAGRHAGPHLPQPAADRLLGQRPKAQAGGARRAPPASRLPTCPPRPRRCPRHGRGARRRRARRAGRRGTGQAVPGRARRAGRRRRAPRPARGGRRRCAPARASARAISANRTGCAWSGSGGGGRPAARRDEVKQRAALPEGQRRRDPALAGADVPAGGGPEPLGKFLPGPQVAGLRRADEDDGHAGRHRRGGELVREPGLAPPARAARPPRTAGVPGAHRASSAPRARRARPPGRPARAGCR